MKIGVKLMYGFLRLVSALPLGFHYACASFISWVLRDLLRYRRDVVMTNLARSFPDKNYGDLKQIARRFYRHFGTIIADTVWFGGCTNEERFRKQRLFELANPEVLEEAFRNSPGVMILDSHCGNWELLGGLVCYSSSPAIRGCYARDDAIVVYKPLSSDSWNEIMRLNRCAGVPGRDYKGYISSRDILRFALSSKERKQIYIVPADQYPYRDAIAPDPVEFMHQPTQTMLGGASIARKRGMSVLYMNHLPVSKGHYTCSFTEISPDASRMTPHEIMVKFYSLLQQDIEETPWNYLWTHKRWK